MFYDLDQNNKQGFIIQFVLEAWEENESVNLVPL